MIEAEWLNFDALNLEPGPPGPRPCRTPSATEPARRPPASCARTPARCRSRSMLDPRRRRSTCVCPGTRVPHRRATTPRTRRCSTRSRASPSTRASRWRTSRARWTTSPRQMFGDEASRSALPRRRTSRSPSRPPRSTWSASSAGHRVDDAGSEPCRTCGRGLDRVGRLRHGQPQRPAGLPASTRTRYSGFAFGMGIDRTLMFRNERRATCATLIEGDVRFSDCSSGCEL